MPFTFIGQNKEAEAEPANAEAKPKSFTYIGQEEPESFLMSYQRTLNQIPAGFAKKFTQSLSYLPSVASGILNEEEAQNQLGRRLANKAFPEQATTARTPEERQQQQEQINKYTPTQEKGEEILEENLGIPLKPKNDFQKGIRFASEIGALKPGKLLEGGGKLGEKVARINPGTVGRKLGAGAAAGTARELLIDIGVPEPLAEAIAGFIGLRKPKEKVKIPEVGKAPSPISSLPGGKTKLETNPIKSEFEAGTAIQKEVGKRVPKAPPRPPDEPPLPPGAPGPGKELPTKPEKPEAYIEPISPKTDIQDIVKEKSFLEKLIPASIPTEAKPIKGKIKEIEKPLGIKIERPLHKHNPEDEMKRIFSPTKTESTTKGGTDTKQEINLQDQELYKKVGKEYRKSEKANSHIQAIHPEYAAFLQKKIHEISAIDHPSTVQNSLKKAMQNVLNGIAILDDKGNITGYKPKNNQDLINQKQSFSQIVDFDFAHGNPYNIFKPLITATNNAVLQAAAQDPKALVSYKKANEKYGEWADLFSNDYMKPWRDQTNKDFSKLYESAKNVDEFNQLKKVLNASKKGKQLLHQLQADLVEKKIMPHFKKNDAQAFQEALKEIKHIITPSQAQRLKNDFYKQSNLRKKNISDVAKEKKARFEHQVAKHKAKVEAHNKQVEADKRAHKEKMIAYQKNLAKHNKEKEAIKKEAAEKKATHEQALKKYKETAKAEKEKYDQALKTYEEEQKGRRDILNSLPEKVAKKLDTVSGIKEVKNELSKTKEGEELYKRIINYKAADILSKGKLNPSEEGKDLVALLNDKETVAVLNELLGPNEVQHIKDVFENVDKMQKMFSQMAAENPKFTDPEKALKFMVDAVMFAKSPHKWAKLLLTFAKNPLWLTDIGKVALNLSKKPLHNLKDKVKGFDIRNFKETATKEGFTSEQVAEFGKKFAPHLKNFSTHLAKTFGGVD